MKKQLLLFCLCATVLPVLAYQVSTDVRQKSILLEEFTGIHCGYCPQGHTIAKNLLRAQPDCMYVIAVHAGHYAIPRSDEPDFRTEYGENLDAEMKPGGYPSATINRHQFPGGVLCMSRSLWTPYSKTMSRETAPVNLYMKAEVDGSTRELKVRIEGYYTGQPDESFHMLNIALLQNNIKGPQSGGGVGSDYVHQHMLRDYITGQWGDTIYAPRQGEYFEKEYTWRVPADYKGVEVELGEIELVVFVCEDKKEVLNVTGGKPDYKNYDRPLSAVISFPDGVYGSRYGYNHFPIQIKNESSDTITSAEFDVTMNGQEGKAQWKGAVLPFREEIISVRFPDYVPVEENQYTVKLVGLNGTEMDGNTLSNRFEGPIEACRKIYVDIQTDMNASDNTYTLRDRDGNIIKEFGPFADGKKEQCKDTLDLEEGIYCFEITDAWGDGILASQGYYKLKNEDGTLVAQNYGVKDFGERIFFYAVRSGSGIDERVFSECRNRVLSGPSGTCTVVVCGIESGPGKIELYDLTGRRIREEVFAVNAGQVTYHRIITAGLPKGIYIVKIDQAGRKEALKFVVE